MTLRLQSTSCFHGPNVWTTTPVLCVDLIAPIPQAPVANSHRDALERMFQQLGSKTTASLENDPKFTFASSNPIEWAGRLSIALQRRCEVPVERSFHQSDTFAFEVLHERTGKAAAFLALRLLNHIMFGSEPEFDLEREVDRLARLNRAYDHGPVGRAIAAEARRRGIPIRTVDPRGRIVELGDGCYRQRVLGTMTSRTTALGNLITDDKLLTNRFLASAGFPVPAAVPVLNTEKAAERAAHIGYPVVLKPVDQADSYLVFVDIRDETELRERFEAIKQGLTSRNKPLLLERFVPGNVYRALVVGDEVAAVFQRVPPHVFGDGASTVQQLVEQENADPRRLRAELRPILIDAESLLMLKRQRLSLDSIPESDLRVELKPQIGHKRDGGLARDCTDELHPDNARLLIQATRTMELDVAGIDFVTTDCSRPMIADGGAIIEINSRPDFERHLRPSEGRSRNASVALIAMLFPPGLPVRVPVIAVTHGIGSSELCHEISQHLSDVGFHIGLATTEGISIDGLPRQHVGGHNPTGPRTLLNNPSVEVAVVDIDPASIVENGLGFDACDVVVLLALSGILRPSGEPIETVLIDALDDTGLLVLDAGIPTVETLADRFSGAVVRTTSNQEVVSAIVDHRPTSSHPAAQGV